MPIYLKVWCNNLKINNPLSLTSIQCKTLELLIPGIIYKESEKSNTIYYFFHYSLHANQDEIKGNTFYFKKAILIFFQVLNFPGENKNLYYLCITYELW